MLEQDGVTIRFQHRVPVALEFESGGTALREGTACEVKLDDEVVGVGFSVVHPNDHYCRAAGRRHSLTNALVLLPRELRSRVWKAYWKKRGQVGHA